MTPALSNYDFIFGIIVLVSAIFGIMRGGVAELLATSTWFIALFIMRQYSSQIEAILPSMISNQILRSLLSYVIAFVGVAIVITIIKLIFHKIIKNLGLGGLNYLIGALFGVVRGLIISALIIVVIEVFHFDAQQSWRSSLISPLLVPTVGIIVNQMNEIKPIDTTANTISQIRKLQNQSEDILGK